MSSRDPAADPMPRRWTDAVEDVTAWALSVLALLTVLVAAVVGIGAYGDAAREAEAGAATRTTVTATVLESVPLLALEQPPSDVAARWTGPDGEPRTGVVPVAPGTSAGDGVPIWVDGTGAHVPPPPTRVDAVAASSLSGLAVLIAGGTVGAAGWLLVRWVTTAANTRRWAREWEVVGPSWTGQR